MSAAAGDRASDLRCAVGMPNLGIFGDLLVLVDLAVSAEVVFGAGLGSVPEEWSAFGEDPTPRVRADRMDEGLTILAV